MRSSAPVWALQLRKGSRFASATSRWARWDIAALEVRLTTGALRILCSISSTTSAAWSPFTAIPEAAKLAYLGLYALQHRGQESAGICTTDGNDIYTHKSMGHVADIFTQPVLATLPGELAIGHTRYSTAGDTVLLNAQPFSVRLQQRPRRGGAQRQHHERRRTAQPTWAAAARSSRPRATPKSSCT